MAKTASFALVHLTVAFCVGYALTGSVVVGGAIALVEPAINTVAYFFHEMAWKKADSLRPIFEDVFSQTMLVK
ncbi:DUF2061 domain-containing protein [Cellvibrio polysaccharolyticus]|uniref:DUF2061 domain-containing protein n=1 Tax=Cellvibrio polysaccharolyticus TaxID=2082724 RepID=A0A928YUF1_9GAMM|nr:DUF2061 domain-containing protein [Cellvibrio polysaccharolyticus]MBE8718616.1 DUF2061 domain-containing protein [Cellvibrio polysaccharolyticus]